MPGGPQQTPDSGDRELPSQGEGALDPAAVPLPPIFRLREEQTIDSPADPAQLRAKADCDPVLRELLEAGFVPCARHLELQRLFSDSLVELACNPSANQKLPFDLLAQSMENLEHAHPWTIEAEYRRSRPLSPGSAEAANERSCAQWLIRSAAFSEHPRTARLLVDCLWDAVDAFPACHSPGGKHLVLEALRCALAEPEAAAEGALRVLRNRSCLDSRTFAVIMHMAKGTPPEGGLEAAWNRFVLERRRMDEEIRGA